MLRVGHHHHLAQLIGDVAERHDIHLHSAAPTVRLQFPTHFQLEIVQREPVSVFVHRLHFGKVAVGEDTFGQGRDVELAA